MRVAHRGGDAAIGDDAGNIELASMPRLAQQPFQPRHVEGGIGDLLHREVGRRKFVDELLSPGAGQRNRLCARNGRNVFRCGEIIGSPPRPGTSVNNGSRDPGRRAGATHRRAASAAPAALRWRRSRPAARIGAVRMQKVVLQIDQQQRGRCERFIARMRFHDEVAEFIDPRRAGRDR